MAGNGKQPAKKHKGRTERRCENKQKVREGLGLSAQSAYDQWRQNEAIAKRWWDTFERDFLQTDLFEAGSKGAEFAHVYNQITLGERLGAGMLSMPKAEKKFTTSLQWHAWLLYNLTHQNITYRDGCFFQNGSSRIANYLAMWEQIKAELRDRGRTARSNTQHKSPKAKSDVVIKEHVDTSSSSDEEEELDPNTGVVVVVWINQPEDFQTAGITDKIRVDGFCGHSLMSSRSDVIQRFNLLTLGHTITLLLTSFQSRAAELSSENETFIDMKRKASRHPNDRVYCLMETAKLTRLYSCSHHDSA
ncbi:hypothetical protein IG631_16534 [Alternaria alternata]|nr:hypothetical protein IG631_16534 [Alternaria alternata]